MPQEGFMPIVHTKLPDYVPATVIHKLIGLSPTALLRLVVLGTVKAKIDPHWDYPVFCISDIRAAGATRPRQHQPDALTHTDRGGGRPRKAAKT
jgi:hypothetical protein